MVGWAGLFRFVFYVGCSCMASSMAKDICDSWVGIRNVYYGVGMEVGVRMMIVMLDTNGVCA
jgi:hypothetical protein